DSLPRCLSGEGQTGWTDCESLNLCGDRRQSARTQGSARVVGVSARRRLWLSVMTELKNRGVDDFLIACVDGLKGFPDAIEQGFPDTQVQLCIVHLVRNSLQYVSWKNKKEVAQDLKAIYGSPTAQA